MLREKVFKLTGLNHRVEWLETHADIYSTKPHSNGMLHAVFVFQSEGRESNLLKHTCSDMPKYQTKPNKLNQIDPFTFRSYSRYFHVWSQLTARCYYLTRRIRALTATPVENSQIRQTQQVHTKLLQRALVKKCQLKVPRIPWGIAIA